MKKICYLLTFIIILFIFVFSWDFNVSAAEQHSTVLYKDGTLIINEKSSDRDNNIDVHGLVDVEYEPFSEENLYDWDGLYSAPWYNRRLSVKNIEIGDAINPIKTANWFFDFKNLTTGDFKNLDTSRLTNANGMFSSAGLNSTSVTLDLSGWDTSKIQNMAYMFYNVGAQSSNVKIIGLDNWNTSNVDLMYSMFENAGSKSRNFDIGDLSDWDTSKVTDMHLMFKNTAKYDFNIGDLSNWNTLWVSNMKEMFYNAGYNSTFSIGDLSNWNTSRVKNMNSMFSYSGYSAKTWSIGDLSGWNTSQVTDMSGMFSHAGYNATTWNIGNISGWNTLQVTDMNSMFSYSGYNATTWNVGDLSSWKTSKVTTMSHMFSYAGYNAITWNIGNLSNWNTASVTNMSYMFSHAGRNATTWNIGDLSNWNTASVTNMSYMFQVAGYNSDTWNIGSLSNWDTSNVTNMTNMFSSVGKNASSFSSIGQLTIPANCTINNLIYEAETFKGKFKLSGNLNSYSLALNNAAKKNKNGEVIIVYSDSNTKEIASELKNTTTNDSNVILYSTYVWPVNVSVVNGNANPSSLNLHDYDNAEFYITPNEGYVEPLINCDGISGDKKWEYEDNKLTIENVENSISCTVKFRKSISNISLDSENYIYNTNEIKPALNIYDGQTLLEEGSDYSLEYANNINVGQGVINIIYSDDYIGDTTKYFEIKPADMSDTDVLGIENKTYNGSEQTQSITIKYANKILVEGKDFDLIYNNNQNAGEAEVTISGKENYTGVVRKAFTIYRKNLLENAVTGITNKTYNRSKQVQSIVVKDDDKRLLEGKDYDVVYRNNQNAGESEITINGKGNYVGTIRKTFNIYRKNIQDLYLTGVTNKVYNGSEQKQKIRIFFEDYILNSTSDYNVKYVDNIDVGIGVLVITGKGNYEGTIIKEFNIIKADNQLTVKTSNKKIKYKKLKKKKQVVKAITVNNNQGKVAYVKLKGSSKKISINETTGKIIVKKGTKKGKYKIRVKVTASGNANYKSGYKIITVKIRVK